MGANILDVLTIGDALITMNPMSNGPLRFVNSFERKVGGAELNVAIGCSRLGLKTGWISRLGQDEFGRHIYSFARGEGIDVEHVKLVEGFPTSVYFKEILNGNRINSYYYRGNSPTETFETTDIDEEYVKQFKVIHVSGVFSAIHKNNREIILALLKIAKKNNVYVTLDPNIRLKLWSAEEARNTLCSYLPYVDMIMMGEEEAEILFSTSKMDELTQLLEETYSIKNFVLKRGSKGAVGYEEDQITSSPALENLEIVDEIGAGDAFASGYIYGIINGWTMEKRLSFANSVAAFVLTVPGDNEGLPYMEDLEKFLGLKKDIQR